MKNMANNNKKRQTKEKKDGGRLLKVKEIKVSRKLRRQCNNDRINRSRATAVNAEKEVSPSKTTTSEEFQWKKSKRHGRRSLKDQTISSDLDNSVLLGASDNEKQGKYLDLQTVRN
jgi:hypothetical protein